MIILMRSFVITFLLVVITAAHSFGQLVPEEMEPDSLVQAFVPVFGYGSSEGFLGGLLYNRYDYRGGVEPFNNYLESSALISTNGFIEIKTRYEQTESFGRPLRSIVETYFNRYKNDSYFGIGNDTEFSNSLWDNNFYYFESIAVGADYRLRTPIYSNQKQQVDFVSGVAVEYHIPYSNGNETAFAQYTPNGSSGGWSTPLHGGLIWENRDNEFDPGRGNRLEFKLRGIPALLGSFRMASAEIDLRQYISPFKRLTVAGRLMGRYATGDIPYWELSKLGDNETLRGYPLNRFQGDAMLAYNLELRSWILKFPQWYDLKFGGQLFTDGGRVFTGADDSADLFKNYKQTFGIGGSMSILSPDFILRGDIGFSEDMTQLYVGIGYLF
jgi:hypothetical protein